MYSLDVYFVNIDSRQPRTRGRDRRRSRSRPLAFVDPVRDRTGVLRHDLVCVGESRSTTASGDDEEQFVSSSVVNGAEDGDRDVTVT
jgi:hypothetical protein